MERQHRRLSDRGKLEFRSLQQDDDLSTWIEAMLALEASGWKGGEGTALASNAADRDFFISAAEGAFRRKQLSIIGLSLDQRWIALRCSFLSSPGAFFFKPAYDEALARHGPGVLLELEVIRDLHNRPDVAWMDSCTSPDNELLNRLWLDRRAVVKLAIATGKGSGGELLLAIIPLLRWIRKQLGAAKAPLVRPWARPRGLTAVDRPPARA